MASRNHYYAYEQDGISPYYIYGIPHMFESQADRCEWLSATIRRFAYPSPGYRNFRRHRRHTGYLIYHRKGDQKGEKRKSWGYVW